MNINNIYLLSILLNKNDIFWSVIGRFELIFNKRISESTISSSVWFNSISNIFQK